MLAEELMRPFYFGGPARRLFGVYDRSHTDGGQDRGVVLCHPYGQEYACAFRAYRTLATRLAGAGFHVLRFDYFGTGDSAGDLDKVSLQQWIGDVVAAVEQVRGTLGHASVSLVGLRLGAALAAMAATECQDVDRLVLWDPVLQGSEYVASLKASHKDWLQALVRELPRARLLSTEDELLGYRFTESLQKDLESINLWSLAIRPAHHVLIVSEDNGDEQLRFAERLQKLGAEVEVKCVGDQKIWSMIPGMQKGLVPNRVLQEIMRWFSSPGL